ncbi:MAG TPA: histidine phosphatase family protein [Patescibacteria group bacterium]|nr:histidine phosphatase family protein [Patescibacteria group bacterium]
MKLYVARHGKTNYNELGLCNGDPTVDVHLTKEGKLQAESLSEKLRDIAIDHIYVSEMKRTQQTADIVNKLHNMRISVDGRLNDNRTGFEGKHFSEYISALDHAAENRWTARFNDGESVEDINARVRSFIAELKTTGYQSILIITSEVIVQAFCGILNSLSNDDARALHVEQGDYIELLESKTD